MGADEFVIDSYKIRQGKLSILEMEGECLSTLDPELLCEYKDLLEDGDVLRIALYHPKRVDLIEAVARIGREVGFRVENGAILLPDLRAVTVAGLTLDEARRKIEGAYRREIADVEIFLAYQEREVRKVELAGLVATPSVPVNGKMRLFDVLSQAKVPIDAGLFKSYLVRGDAPLPIDMYKLMVEGDMSQNVVMQGGDKLYIAGSGSANVMVMGEVAREGIVDLPRGYLPLREVLAKAGGIQFTGDKKYIQIFRGNLLKPKIYNINWKHLIRLPSDSLLVMPGDIVYVAATPITEWNRFISQLFPSLTFIDLFCKGYGGIIAIP